MYKLVLFFALVAVASAGLIAGPAAVAYGAQVAYGAPAVAYGAQVAYGAPAVAYGAPVAAVAAPVAYASGHTVSYHVEPVEQHGYRIAY